MIVVTGAVLASAVLHAVWNALAHRAADPLAAVALVSAGLAALSLPLAVAVPAPAPASWPFLGASVSLHMLYTVLLGRCYRIGEFSQVYPLARGSAPLVVALLAVLLVGERPGAVALAGIAAVCAGLWVLVGAGSTSPGPINTAPINAAPRPRRHGVSRSPAVVAAVATGLAIAGYTTVDGIGVRHAGSTIGYTAWLLSAVGLANLAYAAARYRRQLPSVLRRMWWLTVVGGTIGWASYALVLWAQTRGALAAVAALRETSVVVAAALGAVFFGEPFGRRRILAAVLVAAGVVALSAR